MLHHHITFYFKQNLERIFDKSQSSGSGSLEPSSSQDHQIKTHTIHDNNKQPTDHTDSLLDSIPKQLTQSTSLSHGSNESGDPDSYGDPQISILGKLVISYINNLTRCLYS